LEERKIHIQIAIVLIALIFLVKLLSIQVFDSDLREAADNNIIHRVVEYPLRGSIVDRNGKLIVANRPVFDLMVIPKDLKIEDSATFCQFFGVSLEEARTTLQAARKYSRFKPSVFLKQLSVETYARIQDRLSDYQGIYPVVRTVREYPYESMANALGYVREVDKPFLEKDTSGYYSQGDLIGKSGIEAFYEKELRGQRGVKYVMINVKGEIKGSFKGGALDTLPVVGQTLISSIDIELQKYGELLMHNKKGSIVAIEPETGEILCMVSAPSYAPSLLSGDSRIVSENYFRLLNDPNKPLFNRATMAQYPPGSTFKVAQAMIGLQERALDTVHTSFACIKSLVGCHNHPSPLNVFRSIQHSCNPFYYQAFKKIIFSNEFENSWDKPGKALNHWREHMMSFGLGRRLGLDMPYEKPGLIPNDEYYIKRKTADWKLPNIMSIAIGQGEVGVLPIQLANLSAVIANRGWYITPHLIKGIGKERKPLPIYEVKHQSTVDPVWVDYVARAMREVVVAGTARRAYIPDLPICGKTGTAQNPHGKDHSIFMAFAPLYKPKIAIAVYVENAGFGGTWAAPIAALIIERYVKGEISEKSKALEKYVLEGNLMDPGKPDKKK
jgi:penicillin-binding protein 2